MQQLHQAGAPLPLFLSAQPDEPYFFWQLAALIRNMQALGVPANRIHVLFSYDPGKGLYHECIQFMHDNAAYATFFSYPDIRVSREYLSSVRPNIIKQHARQFPELFRDPIFYHDADILFTDKLPDFAPFLAGDEWYASDTKSYIGPAYIQQFGPQVLQDMCDIVGISPETVISRADQAGGAQYVLKETDYDFWDKVERDAELLYITLERNKPLYAAGRKDYKAIQSWCADMWAVLWNGFLRKKEVVLSPVLDFCWPWDGRQAWEKTFIFHNSGVMGNIVEKYFHKSAFNSTPPYFHTFDHIREDCCSHTYATRLMAMGDHFRADLRDTTFFLLTRIDSEDRLENLHTAIRFLNKYFDTRILIGEADRRALLETQVFPKNVERIFFEEPEDILHITRYNNLLVKAAKTPVVVRYDTDVVMSPAQLYAAVQKVRYRQSVLAYPYDGTFINVHGLYRAHFIRHLGIRQLMKHQDQMRHWRVNDSYGGCVVIDRAEFIRSGMFNEHIHGWGPEDKEVVLRMKILGKTVTREQGPLFHLHHKRGKNSNHFDEARELANRKEVIKISSMHPSTLLKYPTYV